MEQKKKIYLRVALSLIVLLLIQSCASRGAKVQSVSPRLQKRPLAMMGHTIQAGAFGWKTRSV